jgi:flagellar biosynthesis protein FlhB|tara:strand:+ start:667 stop:891 length:225 start_codon:yes stop_codon:yes gene_type:complete
MTQENNDNCDISNILIDYIKEELSKSNIKKEIIKPLLIHLLYYIIPFIILFVLLNFITTIFSVFLAFHFKKIYS